MCLNMNHTGHTAFIWLNFLSYFISQEISPKKKKKGYQVNTTLSFFFLCHAGLFTEVVI